MLEYRISPSYPTLKIGNDGSVIGPSGKKLRTFPDRRGYHRMNIFLGSNPKRWKQLGAHRLVCEAFHGPPPTSKHIVAHNDGDPSNNRADNLRWATHKENEEDKKRHGRGLQGVRHHQAKLSEEEVRLILTTAETGYSLARRLGVTQATISNIRLGKNWTHLRPKSP